MRRAKTFFFLGIWIALLPYLGFPYFWKNILFSLSGLLLSVFGYMIYREHKRMSGFRETFENFSENAGFSMQDIQKELVE